MKELFPLRTFHQDAVLARLGELYDNEVDLDSRVEDLEDLPTPVVADAGKVVQVGDDGKYKLASVGAVTPLYYHPVVIWGKSESETYKGCSLSLVALTNSGTAFDIQSFLNWIKTNTITYLAPASGSVYYNSKRYIVSWIDITYADGEITTLQIRGHAIDENIYLQEIHIPVADLLSDFRIGDSVNQIL